MHLCLIGVAKKQKGVGQGLENEREAHTQPPSFKRVPAASTIDPLMGLHAGFRSHSGVRKV